MSTWVCFKFILLKFSERRFRLDAHTNTHSRKHRAAVALLSLSSCTYSVLPNVDPMKRHLLIIGPVTCFTRPPVLKAKKHEAGGWSPVERERHRGRVGGERERASWMSVHVPPRATSTCALQRCSCLSALNVQAMKNGSELLSTTSLIDHALSVCVFLCVSMSMSTFNFLLNLFFFFLKATGRSWLQIGRFGASFIKSWKAFVLTIGSLPPAERQTVCLCLELKQRHFPWFSKQQVHCLMILPLLRKRDQA